MSTKKHVIIIACLLVAGLLMPAPARGQLESFDRWLAGTQAPIELTSDKLGYDEKSGLVEAQGDVHFKWKDFNLRADSVSIILPTGDIAAKGNVVFNLGNDSFSCREFEYNFNTYTGMVYDAELHIIDGNYYLTGKNFELKEHLITARDATLTSCPGDPPAWRFRARRVKLIIEGYAGVSGARFEIHNVPVLYVPWIGFPIKTIRQSGFLVPVIGYSDEKGLRFNNFYFWAISPHMDATFNLDVMTGAGIGAGAEFRYKLKNHSGGRLRGFYLREYDPGDNRGSGSYEHDQYFDRTFYLKADIKGVSDQDYFQDYGEYLADESQDHLQSDLYGTKNWSAFTFSLGTTWRQFLDLPEGSEPQELPWLSLAGSYLRLGETPLRFSIETQAENLWQRKDDSTPLQPPVSGRRVDIQPSISVPFAYENYFSVIPSFTWRETLYDMDDDDLADRSNRELYELSLWMGTSLSRTYRPEWKLLRACKHYVEPALRYNYIPDVDQDDLPYIDAEDRVEPAHQLRVELVNRLIAPEKNKGYLNMLYLNLGSAHNFSFINEQGESWSLLYLDYRLQPVRALILGGEARYPLKAHEAVRNQYHYLQWRYNEWGKAEAGYSYERNSHDYISVELYQKLTDFLAVEFNKKHSFADDAYLEDIYGLRYLHECWEARVRYIQRPDEKRFEFYVTLLGIGQSAEFKTGLP
jgi:LPS-assembly protein